MGLLSALGLSVPKSLAARSGKLESTLAPPPVRPPAQVGTNGTQVTTGTTAAGGTSHTDPDDAAPAQRWSSSALPGHVPDDKLKSGVVAEPRSCRA